MHGCRCSHFGTEHVQEEHEGKLVWEGDVEIFQLEGHLEANVAYGWAWEDDTNEINYIGILQLPPIQNAYDSVKAAIVSGNFMPVEGSKTMLTKEVRERAAELKPMLERDLQSFKISNEHRVIEYDYSDLIEYCPKADSRTERLDGLAVDEEEVQSLANKIGLTLRRGDHEKWASFIFSHPETD